MTDLDFEIWDFNEETAVQGWLLRTLTPAMRPYAPSIYHMSLTLFSQEYGALAVVWNALDHSRALPSWTEWGATKLLDLARTIVNDASIDVLSRRANTHLDWRELAP